MSSRTSPVVHKTIDVFYHSRKKQSSLIWSMVNGILFLLCSYHLSNYVKEPNTFLQYFEYALASILILNVVYHIIHYVTLCCTFSPVEVTQAQRKLLGFKDCDASFRLLKPTTTEPCSTILDTSDIMDLSSKSWLNSSSGPNSITSNSWTFHQRSNSTEQDHSPFFWSKKDEFISDHDSLQDYLRRFEEKQTLANLSSSSQEETWSPRSEGLRRAPLYQIALLDNSASKHQDDSCFAANSPRAWLRLRVDAKRLNQWNLNLRLWISKTILERLVKEITNVDENLHRVGMSDIKVGMVGLDKLRQNATVAGHVPSLPTLISFLEVSNNQEYVVQRIKELAEGGCMSAYKWNKGGRFHAQDWTEALPTDAALVMHLIAKYLDTQILPTKAGVEKAAFSSEYYCAHGSTWNPSSSKLPVIAHTKLHPPHFLLFYDERTAEVDKGRNNMFHTFLFFLHLITEKYDGMLGRINLGPSGLNLLWVIE